MKRLFILFGVIFVFSTGFTQNFNSDMKKVRETYSKLKHFECVYDIRVYFNDKLHSSLVMDVKFSDSNYYYKIGKEITSICNSQNILTLDYDLKIIAIGERKSFAVDFRDYLSNVDDSINYTIQNKIESNGFHTYTLIYNKGMYLFSTITINPENGYITYLDYTNRVDEEYDWRIFSKRKTVIKFINLNSIEKLPDSYFSLSNFIIKTNGQYLPTKQYSNYQIIDTTLKPAKK